jgi:hypothetical protein
MKSCSRCNQQSPEDANFCHQCGAALGAGAGTADHGPAAAQAAEPAESSVPPPIHDDETLWRQFIGPNADRYLATFKRFSSNGRPKFALSWNWPAFLFISFLWFLYRKMYLHAFVYAVGPMISTYLTGDFSAGIIWSVMAGATANYLYYWHCREHIGEIQKAGRMNPAEQETALKESGGVQSYVIWVGVAFYLIFLVTLAKMIQEGAPDPDTRPAKPERSAAMMSMAASGVQQELLASWSDGRVIS